MEFRKAGDERQEADWSVGCEWLTIESFNLLDKDLSTVFEPVRLYAVEHDHEPVDGQCMYSFWGVGPLNTDVYVPLRSYIAGYGAGLKALKASSVESYMRGLTSAMKGGGQ